VKNIIFGGIPLLVAVLGVILVGYGAMHAGGHGAAHLEHANIDVGNEAAIHRGAKMFVNYCMGCHSAEHVRYKQLTKVGLSEDNIKNNLIFGDHKVGDLMKIAMPGNDAANWFGAAAPDLSLVNRLRGSNWVYSYLKGFYLDDSRPFGVNNTVLENAGMPHVLWELQGVQEPVYKEVQHGDETEKVLEGLKLAEPGSMTPAEYDALVRDLVTFLAYIGEPVKQERQRLGLWVILFLIVFSVVAYLMKKEYWKDVH
jgi:ubiquinol-cytochrome c reductase cytochrome c1 subunit